MKVDCKTLTIAATDELEFRTSLRWMLMWPEDKWRFATVENTDKITWVYCTIYGAHKSRLCNKRI